jgi:uncharacterized protein YbaA (DUF1428 family)
MPYVDGFVLAIPKKNLPAYRRMAKQAGKLWRSHGALEFHESAGDDLQVGMGLPFGRLLKLRRGETALFSWIVYRSRAQRDKVNAKVMKDPRLAKMMTGQESPFDSKRMIYGGFTSLVKV